MQHHKITVQLLRTGRKPGSFTALLVEQFIFLGDKTPALVWHAGILKLIILPEVTEVSKYF